MTTTISLIVAEAALETVPDEIAGHPAVKRHAQRLGLRPSEILLDRSYHHAAMKKLLNERKRGRPDIVHFALLEALATPLFLKGMLNVYIHTAGDKLIIVANNLRAPKSYFRFEGVMLSLFRDKVIRNDEGAVLLEMHDGTLASLINNTIKPDRIIGLSTAGIRSTAEKAVAENIKKDGTDHHHCAFVVGGFPRGHFSENVAKLLNVTYSISDLGLESHVVIARILYECEKQLNVT